MSESQPMVSAATRTEAALDGYSDGQGPSSRPSQIAVATWKGPGNSTAAPQRPLTAPTIPAIGSKSRPIGSAAGGERLGWTSSAKA